MKTKEFSESIMELLSNGVYYHNGTQFESPHLIKQISDHAIVVEFFYPEDTFMVTMERRNDLGKS